jgi:O-methyltransferase
MSLGDGEEFHSLVNQQLRRQSIRFEVARLEEIASWGPERLPALAAIVCAYPDSRRTTQAAGILAHHRSLADVRFEYVCGLEPERELFAQLDEYSTTWFSSPVLLADPSPYAIYQESLNHFEQKCGLRDFLDLYQLLRSVVENGVTGDVAEFGSYRGHSGYLIARTLESLGSDKRLFMFDTFEEFPHEDLGVDQFWSRTHDVDFSDVQAKLHVFDRVTIVRGDFVETLGSTNIESLALAYIDCDSYRATKFLLDALLPTKISSRGVIVCEDYGHPALLGSRVAVHESLTGTTDCLQFFSQFSGVYIVQKF